MSSYKGLTVVDNPVGSGGQALTGNFQTLADRAVQMSTSDPTTSNNSSSGFVEGSLWENTTDQTVWMCLSSSTTTASWKSLFQRTTTGLKLAPVENDDVNIGGALNLTGNLNVDGDVAIDGELAVAGTGTSSVAGQFLIGSGSPETNTMLHVQSSSKNKVTLKTTSGSFVMWLEGYTTGNESVSMEFRRQDSGGNRTLLSRLFSTHTSIPDQFRIDHRISNATVGSIDIASSGNIGLNVAAPKASLHSTGSTIVGASNAAANNSDIGNGQVNIWLNESTNILTFKVKRSDGTIKTGTIALV